MKSQLNILRTCLVIIMAGISMTVKATISEPIDSVKTGATTISTTASQGTTDTSTTGTTDTTVTSTTGTTASHTTGTTDTSTTGTTDTTVTSTTGTTASRTTSTQLNGTSETTVTSTNFPAASNTTYTLPITKATTKFTTSMPLNPTPSTTSSQPSVPITVIPPGTASTAPETTIKSTALTTPIKQTSKKECQNSGIFEGNKCVCLKLFFGSLCEFIQDRIEMGSSVKATTKMTVTVTNRNLTNRIKNKNGKEYENFEETFKEKINRTCEHIKEFRGVEITNMKPGSIIVEYNLTLEISYQENISVTAQYEDLLQTITKAVEKTDNYSIYCPYEGNLCFNNSRWLQRASLRSEEDSCRNETPSGFEEFFKASIIGGNLVCLSDCNPQSKKNYDCNVGICQIQNGTGPHCLCPRTDLYIYSSEKCNGQMLKSAVYGGVGAAIAVLGVIIAAVGFLLIRAKKHKKLIPLAKNQEDKWYEDENDNEWSSRRGFSTINYGAADGEEGNTNGSYSSSNIGSFRPALQNVDTALRVKIRRPVITKM